MVKKFLLTFFLVLVQTVVFGANISSTSTGGNWSATTTWVGGVVPSPNDNVTVVSGSNITLDTNITIGNGTYTFNGNVTDNGIHTLTATTNGGVLIISNNSTTTIGGLASWDNSTITVNAGSTLVTGATTIGNGTGITITGNLFVNGDLTDNNNGGPSSFFSVTGYVQVYGNYIAPVGSVSVSGAGVFQTTGTIITNGSSTVGGSTNNCTTGPCSSGSIGCGDGTNSYFSSISPTNQVLCSGQTITPLSFVSGTTVTSYQWQISTTNGGTGFTDITGATTSSYSPPQPAVATWYRMKYSTSSCSNLISPSSRISLNNNTPPAAGAISGGNVSYCSNTNSTSMTLSGYTATGFQWQSSSDNITFANISGATLVSYTAVNVSSTTYYRVVVSNGSCNTVNTSSVAINKVLAPPTPTGSSSQSFCSGATVANLAATGTAILWYAASSGGSALATTTLLVNGIHYYASQTIGCESSARFDVTATISPTTVGGTVSGGTTICSGNTSAILTLAGHVGTIAKWQSSVSPFSTWTDIANTATTYTSVTLTATTQFRAVVQSGSCATVNSAATTVTVNALPSALSVTTTQPTCAVPTATITITAVAGETYSFDGSAYLATLVYSGLAQGSSHSIYAKNTAGCISSVTNTIINTTDKTWNGAWLPSAPTSADNIVFTGTGVYNSTGDLTACSCQVTGNVTVNINSGNTLTLTNQLAVTSFGSITFHNNASLVQINNVVNTGDIDYVRTTNTVVRNTDYTYWSSPVSPQTIGGFSPYTPDGMMYSYNSNIEDWKQEYLSTSMSVGIGYIVRGPEPPGPPLPPSQYTAIFTGAPNNGHYEINGLFANKSYLLGNPYPSALDAETFLNDNAGVLNGTLYFWTHNTQIGIGVSNPGTGVYAYSGDDYATYNATGGVAATQLDINPITGLPYPGSAPSGSPVPTGKIASGQGFFASTKTSLLDSKIVFDNTMRLAGNNSQFFKKRSTKTEKVIEKNRVWLNLTNTQGAFKQTLVGYVTNATNDYDDRFDGETFDGNVFVDFYSVNQDKNLVIQGRALPFDENDEVPLGYRTTINGAFTINIDQVDGLLTNQAVFIEDKLTNTVTDLKNGNYTFNTVAGTFNDRFVLRYTNKTLATATFNSLENTVLVSNKNKQIKINSFAQTIDKVTIYDLLGREIYQKINVNSNELSIANLVSSRQPLIVKMILQNGATVTDKIIF